ncbi:MAG: hypothetical protein JXA66_08630 [Oligoflexia bacterium]|nr:hypothetical protein [Oligoflexia bacterium]
MKNKVISYKIPVMLIKRKKELVEAHMPSIDTVTQGKNARDALRMAKEAADIFFEEAVENDTLNELLLHYGWQKAGSRNELKEPQTIGTTKFVEIKIPKAA